jgi:hypothetical protein
MMLLENSDLLICLNFYLSFSVCFILQARHVFYLFCQFINHMEAIWLPVYYPSQEEKDDPKLYASNVRRLMACEVCISLILDIERFETI